MDPKPRFAQGGISYGPNSFNGEIGLEQAFYDAVSRNCGEEEINKILDEKNRLDAENRRSIRLGFQISLIRSDMISIPDIPCP